MNRNKYEDFIRCFKSHKHILDMHRRLGKDPLNVSMLVRVIRYEKIEELLNKGRSVRYIVRMVDTSKTTVYRLRDLLWNKKK